MSDPINIRLPQHASDELRAIAKLAGLPVASVIKFIIAAEIRRITKSAEARSQESKTPRTDAEDAKYASISKVWYVPADFARQLERELAAVTEDRDAFMASSRITKANEATANARIAFMSDAEAKVAQYPPGWRCEWVCDWGDQRSTACYPEALEAIDAAMKECSELRAAREIEPKGSDQ